MLHSHSHSYYTYLDYSHIPSRKCYHIHFASNFSEWLYRFRYTPSLQRRWKAIRIHKKGSQRRGKVGTSIAAGIVRSAMGSHLSSLSILELWTIGNAMSKTWMERRRQQFLPLKGQRNNTVPPQTGHPLSDPPWAALGSSMVCKKGGTLIKTPSVLWSSATDQSIRTFDQPPWVNISNPTTSAPACSCWRMSSQCQSSHYVPYARFDARSLRSLSAWKRWWHVGCRWNRDPWTRRQTRPWHPWRRIWTI